MAEVKFKSWRVRVSHWSLITGYVSLTISILLVGAFGFLSWITRMHYAALLGDLFALLQLSAFALGIIAVLLLGRNTRKAQLAAVFLASMPVLLILTIPFSLDEIFGGRSMHMRACISRTRYDMRTMAEALVAYRLEHQVLPPWTTDQGKKLLPTFSPDLPALMRTPMLTMPILQAHFGDGVYFDRFGTADSKIKYAYPYWSRDSDWYIIWCAGPDFDYDLTLDAVQKAYRPDPEESYRLLIDNMYDPTNGSLSNGDLYRFHDGSY